ncbi:mucin-associated surface protein [Trypanosoma cruzi cruzi]|uniref:Mucin-associated surface protein (MASP) n=1 Tax=Trypanosoma cruzi TaxID=5693 RepID=A0A2V2W2M6_TRYCR|nr:mucin-associated surface protein [Trypanosoma cruzi cruzi]PWV01963.1 Mucin-associated surface protein (MASP) [Trypanosoma cruzi]
MVLMMMTGRVLLVCALCVLWCGAGSLAEEGPGGTPPDASSSGVGERLQESSLLLQEGLQKSVSEGPEVKDTTGGPDKEILLKEEEDEDEEITPSEEIPPSSPTPPGGGGVPQAADGKLKKVNEGGPKPENQRPVEAGKHQSEKETIDAGEAEVNKQNEGSGLQLQDNPNPVQEEDTKNGEGHQLTQEKEQQTNVEATIQPRNPAGDHSSGQHEGNDGSNEEKEGEEKDDDNTSEGMPAGGQEKRNSTSGPEGAPNKMNTEGSQTPGDSDGSTAVSHTTSPLLLLLVVVACAAAAAVVAA